MIDEELYILDLCARLPYETKAQIIFVDDFVYEGYVNCSDIEKLLNKRSQVVKTIKPYLFPMSEVQMKEYLSLVFDAKVKGDILPLFKWLNSHHYDYNGLIEKGLAIDATNLNIY